MKTQLLVLGISLVQGVLVFGVLVPLGWLERGIRVLNRFMTISVYYRLVVFKRRSIGEPLWQEHDLELGIPDPQWASETIRWRPPG